MRKEQILFPVVRQVAKRPRLAGALFRLRGYESPFVAERYSDPYASFERMRQRRSAEDKGMFYHRVLRQWMVVGHEETLEVLRSPSISVAGTIETYLAVRPYSSLSPTAKQAFSQWLLFIDGPDHTRLRSLVSRAFTPKSISSLEPRIRTIVDELLDDLRTQNHPDVMAGFAVPLPIFIIGELLGLPREQWDWLRAASRVISGLIAPFKKFDALEASRTFEELHEYFARICEQRRNEPRNDLISILTQADIGERLTTDELIAMIGFLMFAGHETTSALLGNSIVALANNPAQRSLLIQQPNLIENAVEELIRFDTSVPTTARTATDDIEIAGHKVKSGQRIGIVWSAANRDPNRFSDANELRLDRSDPRPISFGHGIHHCLGAALARLELKVAVPAFLAAFGEYGIDPDTIRWNQSLGIKGPTVLRITDGAQQYRAMSVPTAYDSKNSNVDHHRRLSSD
jgi:pimeloyl-[acyl-carrier protein] synthase